MSFSYDLESLDPMIVIISQIRLEIGDTIMVTGAGTGIRPDGSRFKDAEILYFYSKENSHLMRTVAAMCESLSVAWSHIANSRLGPYAEDAGRIAEQFAKRGEKIREDYGYGNENKLQNSPFSLPMRRY